jgi:hypothetical protein
MRIRSRKNLRKKNVVIVFLFLIPMIGFLGYAGIFLYILNDINSYTFMLDPPKTEYFYDINDINETTLLQVARDLDYRLIKYNSPVGFPVDVTFKNYGYNDVAEWHHTDNGALHAAYGIAAACYKYDWAKRTGNTADLINATNDIRIFVQAFDDLIAAPNGGFGINPDTGTWFPGIVSRFAVNYLNASTYHPFMLTDHPRHHNGSGDYSNWRVRFKTSRDEVSGYYLGWATVLKYVTGDDPISKWCVEHVKRQIGQVLNEWRYNSNWLVLDWNGYPTGSDINSAIWQLVGLRIGATAYPEEYGSLYQYAASKLLSLNSATMGDLWNAANEYYAWMLAANSMFSLILLEDNPQLRFHYIKNYEDGMYNVVKYHRNAYFNMMHLVFMSMLTDGQKARFKNPQYGDDKILWDAKDQLWRFYASNWAPIRNYNLTTRPKSTRSTSLNPLIKEKKIFPQMKNWQEWLENNPIGKSYDWIVAELINFDQELYMVPRTISECLAQHMIWQSNPFKQEGGDPKGNGLIEPPGTSYTTIYWQARAFDIF